VTPALERIDQLGYVVGDVDAAMKHWIETLGVGPFFYFPNPPIRDVMYRGKPSPIEIEVALSYVGDLQIELIEQVNDAASCYRDFLAVAGGGLHHLCSFTDAFDADAKRLTERGLNLVQSGVGGATSRFGYFGDDAPHGTMIELYEAMEFRAFFDEMAAAARTWDGAHPIREIRV
jgi:hypothetical protein